MLGGEDRGFPHRVMAEMKCGPARELEYDSQLPREADIPYSPFHPPLVVNERRVVRYAPPPPPPLP